ncbi:carbohydrate ABC transporter permease [Candidatus Gracilibacteria bacterium]|nr:carbohydrate ABC transporter permease [Candidatus Gracilibacteria bacterium]
MLRRSVRSQPLFASGVGNRPGLLAAGGLYTVLLLMAALVGLPFFWMIVSSLKPLNQVFNFEQWLPSPPLWENYGNALQKAPFGRYLFNSTFTSVAILFGQYLTIIPAAYAFARLTFPGRNTIFLIILATIMVPIQVTFIPAFVVISAFDWKDTYWALIIPFITSAFGIFLLRQSFLQVPQDYLDAARLDGVRPHRRDAPCDGRRSMCRRGSPSGCSASLPILTTSSGRGSSPTRTRCARCRWAWPALSSSRAARAGTNC